MQRLLGTLVGIGAFAVLLPLRLPAAAYVAVLCLLLWLVSRTTSRNYLLGPQLTVPLATRSIRRLARASIAVFEAVAQHRPLAEPQYVERRRRLEYSLFAAGSALDLAGPRTVRRAKPWLDLERGVADVGYLVLGASWDPPVLLETPCATTVCNLLRPLAWIGDDDPASIPSPDALSSAISQLADNDRRDDPGE